MRALLQRVTRAQVLVDERSVGAIDAGILALVAVQRGDSRNTAERLLQRMLGYRMFDDSAGRMNLSLTATGGGLLVVSQFTLAADTRKGMRAGFTSAAAPTEAEPLYEWLVACAEDNHSPVASGQFAACMQVELVNDGPVTFLLEVPPG